MKNVSSDLLIAGGVPALFYWVYTNGNIENVLPYLSNPVIKGIGIVLGICWMRSTLRLVGITFVAIMKLLIVLGLLYVGFYYRDEIVNIATELPKKGQHLISKIDHEKVEPRVGVQREDNNGCEWERGEVDVSRIEKFIFRYTNVERKKYGKKPFNRNAGLTKLAGDHSGDMVNRNFYSHVNPDGENPTARAVRLDYPIRKAMGNGRFAIGIAENIAKYSDLYIQSESRTNEEPKSVARRVVDGWMNSKGHRENILNEQYEEIGIGVAFDGTCYLLTQNFQ